MNNRTYLQLKFILVSIKNIFKFKTKLSSKNNFSVAPVISNPIYFMMNSKDNKNYFTLSTFIDIFLDKVISKFIIVFVCFNCSRLILWRLLMKLYLYCSVHPIILFRQFSSEKALKYFLILIFIYFF